jgi:hypothetical protein
MKQSPELVKVSETVYGCSQCRDFELKIVRPDLKTPKQVEKWVEEEFLDHSKRRHSDVASGPEEAVNPWC